MHVVPVFGKEDKNNLFKIYQGDQINLLMFWLFLRGPKTAVSLLLKKKSISMRGGQCNNATRIYGLISLAYKLVILPENHKNKSYSK
jgi:hypothetical protein